MSKHYSLPCRRHFKPTPGLPERLQPDSIVRRRGLRANVIRALYHTYDPFVERIVGLRSAVFDPHVLRNLICVHAWQTSGSRSGQWKLYVKFQKRNKLASSANAVLWDRVKPKVNNWLAKMLGYRMVLVVMEKILFIHLLFVLPTGGPSM